MDVSIHTRDRSIATSAALLRIDASAVVWIEFQGEPDRHCNPVSDKVTIFSNGRADALRIAQGLREAADKLEAVYAPQTSADLRESAREADRLEREAQAEQDAADESHAEDVAEAMSNNPREEA
jgi:hypothetical protein